MSSYSAGDAITAVDLALDTHLVGRCFIQGVVAPTLRVYGPHELRTLHEYPALYVISPGAQLDPGLEMGAAFTKTKTRIEIALGILQQGADGDALQLNAYKYGEVLVECVLTEKRDNDLSGWEIDTPEPWEINTETLRFGEAERFFWISEVGVVFTMWRYEELSF